MNPDEPLDDILPGQASAPRPAGHARRGAWWDSLSIYLPVLLMGVLALASYWLLRITPPAEAPQPSGPVSTEPDYFMRRFSVKSFDAKGRVTSEVAGDEARHHPDDDRIEIDNARLRRIDEQGLVTTATANRVTSNADHTAFVLEGNAIVIREAGTGTDGRVRPRLEFRGEQFRVTLKPDHVVSDLPVTLLREGDRLQAQTLDYRGDDQIADFKGRVRVTLLPRP